jgi:hypothetical protein
MPDDRLEWFEAALGAVSKIDATDDELRGARCPKCNASDFVRAVDLYSETVVHLEESPASLNTVRVGGLTGGPIVARLAPPKRRSALPIATVVAVPLFAGAYYVLRRFGSGLGEFAFVAAFLVTLVVFMTTLRRRSDEYYDRRKRWRSLFMCRRCGQLVA